MDMRNLLEWNSNGIYYQIPNGIYYQIPIYYQIGNKFRWSLSDGEEENCLDSGSFPTLTTLP